MSVLLLQPREVWLSLFCFLYSVVVFLTLMHQRQRASDSCTEQASQQERQDVYTKLQQYAEHLKTEVGEATTIREGTILMDGSLVLVSCMASSGLRLQ